MTGKFWGLEEAPPVREATERPRKNTIERFNDELSVLERPLEGDVEYYDETPPPARLRKAVAFVMAAGLTAAGSLFIMRHSPSREAVAPSPVRAVVAAPIAATGAAEPAVVPPSPPSSDRAAPPALATADPLAAAPPELAAAKEAPAADDAADDAPAARHAASVKPTRGSRHSRHGKSGGRHHGHHQPR